MKSGNFIRLEFVVKGESQVEFINVEHVSRIIHVEGKPFIGLVGHNYTRQLTEASMKDLTEFINVENI